MKKKFFQKIFKSFGYSILSIIFGKIEKIIETNDDNRIEVKVIKKEENLNYNIYKINEGRLYTDRIQDTAAIIDNKIINGPSFKFRNRKDYKIYNANVQDNIVLKKGTPRRLRNLDGMVLSLLTGGAGNKNYWHWLYDVLPRVGLCSESINLNKIDFFLIPSLLKNFQNESLDILNIPRQKRLSSEKFRHIKAKELIMTDHPVVTTGDATKDIQNIPLWITKWLKSVFIYNETKNKKNDKPFIYIDRNESVLNDPPMRIISNENEVKKYLKDNNFESVKLGEVSFKEQIDLFNNAECIVGLHGAGFANLSFCKPNTKVIELKGINAGPVIENLAKKNKLNYSSISLEAKQIYKLDFPNQHGSIEIPINTLKEALEKK